VSAPEPATRLDGCAMEIVELAALRAGARDLRAIAISLGAALPPPGRAAISAGQLALCVRPERWLLLGPPAPAGATAGIWQAACEGCGAAIERSSALVALQLAGPAAREVLARSCRLDLDLDAFPPGSAAATIMAQVSVILAALPSGLLLLTPSSTARHFREWLRCAAQPFGLAPPSELSFAALTGDP
jgi:heterotetrameric sarcosine oxidase gamma subunit